MTDGEQVVDAVTGGLIATGVAAVTGLIGGAVLVLNSALDRKQVRAAGEENRLEKDRAETAEARADRAERDKADLDRWTRLAAEYRLEIDWLRDQLLEARREVATSAAESRRLTAALNVKTQELASAEQEITRLRATVQGGPHES